MVQRPTVTIKWNIKETGSFVSFGGDKIKHGGNVVTKGVRYILTIFFYLDTDSCAPKKREDNKSVQPTGMATSESQLSNEAKRLKPAENGFSFAS